MGLFYAATRAVGLRPRKNFQWTDPNVPAAEIEWLETDLKATDCHVIVFAHQRLDVSNNYGVKNAAEVRQVLESSGRVVAVFEGHSHENAKSAASTTRRWWRWSKDRIKERVSAE